MHILVRKVLSLGLRQLAQEGARAERAVLTPEVGLTTAASHACMTCLGGHWLRAAVTNPRVLAQKGT